MAPLRLDWIFPQLIETQWMLPPERPGAQAVILSVPGPKGDPAEAIIPPVLDGGNF